MLRLVGFVWGEHLFLEVERRALTEAAGTTAAVVEGFDVVESQEFSRGAGGRGDFAEAFGFQRGDEAFCQGVVVRIGRATHVQSDAVGVGESGEVRGGVLDAAIAMVEQAGRWRPALDGEGEGRGGEFRSHVGTAVVGDAAAGAGVEGEGEKEPAFAGFEVGKVALPDEAGPIRRGDFSRPVFGDGMSVAAVGGAGPEAPLLPRPQATLPHEPGDAIFAAALAAVLGDRAAPADSRRCAGSPRSFAG